MTHMKHEDVYVQIAEFYDHVVPYRNRPDVMFYVDAAKESGGPVLEIGCGTGRILIPTAREEVNIVGLDVSTAMLQICRQRLKQEPEAVQACVELVQADMREFVLSQTFKLITFPFRPFQHLTTVKDQCACLKCAYRHLDDGGKLILDLFNPSLHVLADDENLGKEGGEEPEFTMLDGRRVVRWHKFVSRDLFNQVQHVELIHYVTHPDGRQERLVMAFDMRYLFRFEAEHLLARCGFQVEQVYADYEKNPYGSKYPGDLIILAKKS
jgi:ubiquinone/menaquinone biosynthesis C-methylase UbiE